MVQYIYVRMYFTSIYTVESIRNVAPQYMARSNKKRSYISVLTVCSSDTFLLRLDVKKIIFLYIEAYGVAIM